MKDDDRKPNIGEAAPSYDSSVSSNTTTQLFECRCASHVLCSRRMTTTASCSETTTGTTCCACTRCCAIVCSSFDAARSRSSRRTSSTSLTARSRPPSRCASRIHVRSDTASHAPPTHSHITPRLYLAVEVEPEQYYAYFLDRVKDLPRREHGLELVRGHFARAVRHSGLQRLLHGQNRAAHRQAGACLSKLTFLA